MCHCQWLQHQMQWGQKGSGCQGPLHHFQYRLHPHHSEESVGGHSVNRHQGSVAHSIRSARVGAALGSPGPTVRLGPKGRGGLWFPGSLTTWTQAVLASTLSVPDSMDTRRLEPESMVQDFCPSHSVLGKVRCIHAIAHTGTGPMPVCAIPGGNRRVAL